MFDLVNENLDKFAAMGHGLEAIETISRWALDGDGRDGDAVHTIASITDTIRGMFHGKISAQDTEEEIVSLQHALIGVDQKFDGSEV